MWDPNDDQDLKFGIAPSKGRRYFFSESIQVPNWEEEGHDGNVKDNDKVGIIPVSVWEFFPHKVLQKGDYHKVLKGDNFTSWFSNSVLSNLTSTSLIVLDNTK